jgi:alanine-synthesizing transaminase
MDQPSGARAASALPQMPCPRLPPKREANAISRAVARLRSSGVAYLDLTEGNPTRTGIHYPADLLEELASAQALRYDPQPLGLPAAREAVAGYYAGRGATVHPDDVVLTASTSEAYSWLFKLLCAPGERVAVPTPSYPLFEYLTRLDGVSGDAYELQYHRRWDIDGDSVRRAVMRDTRALLVVSPNNPTGSYVTRGEQAMLIAACARHRLALVADEVFADYPLDAPPECVTELALQNEVLAFTLGGLSKSAGLPQTKLGWILVGGPDTAKREAVEALETIADSYLSVSTPIQVAAPGILLRAATIRSQIHRRVGGNLTALRRMCSAHPAVEVLVCEGGWYAVLRVPAVRSEETLVLDLLDSERVLVHPGYFFDFPREAYLIVSLLPEPSVFSAAVPRLLSRVT